MKWSVLLIVLLFVSELSTAQNWNEFFRQRKTQRRYLLEQIASLQIYLQQVREGYELLRSGYQIVHQIRKGEFDLHNLYYISLRKVNPRIRSYVRIAEMVSYQEVVLKWYRDDVKNILRNPNLTSQEKTVVESISQNLLKDVLDIIESLFLVIDDDSLELSDGERIKYINNLYLRIKQRVAFLRNLSYNLKEHTDDRLSESAELSLLNEMYNLNE